jgi:hypothetical protein
MTKTDYIDQVPADQKGAINFKVEDLITTAYFGTI